MKTYEWEDWGDYGYYFDEPWVYREKWWNQELETRVYSIREALLVVLQRETGEMVDDPYSPTEKQLVERLKDIGVVVQFLWA